MSDSSDPQQPASQQTQKLPEGGVSTAQRLMTYCAVILIIVGAFCIALAGLLVYQYGTREAFLGAEDVNPFIELLNANSETVVLLVAGIFAISLGSNMMRRAISASAKTIPDADRMLLEQLISDGNTKALAEYVRLASLTGITGVFTKLGFTGLPLATAALGVFLLLLATFQSGEQAQDLMDLAKLVLGAFIGSFVQRKADRPESDVPLTSGNKVDNT